MNAVSGPRATWLEVVALLTAAADRGFTLAARDRGVHSLAVGAQIVASSALALLPEGADPTLDGLELGAAEQEMDVASLIRTAAQAARRHPIQSFPEGASEVIQALGALVDETTP